jgi:hypothetical protein
VSSSNPAVPEPTEIAGRYQIVKKLGAGAFGTVYKAKDTRLERMVAIKTIRLEGLAASQAGLKEMTDRFEREARTAAKLKHPGIVTIHDYGESQGLSYIAMEFIDGIGIDSVLTETGRMPVERAAALGAQVAEALDYAHSHGVVHRDIKPANIMIEAGDRVKVTDFGIAKPGDSAEHLTVTGSLLGTPSYMSPEQARGQKLDGRSDLFSVGCVLYEMVAGTKAFRGESITALLFKIITEEPPPLRDSDPKVPEEMLRVIAKALAKAPEARYQSGREMADDLLAITRPGFVPTLRAADTPTITRPGETPTVVSAPPAPTPTVASAPTVARGAKPPEPGPTILTPGAAAAVTPPPLPASAKLATGARPVAVPPLAARKSGGSGMGLVLGLGLVGLLLVGAVGIGGYVLYSRRHAGPSPEPSPVANVATPSPTTATIEPTPGAVEATPASGAVVPAAPPATPATRTTSAGVPAVSTRPAAPPRPEPPANSNVATAAPESAIPMGSLDELPPEGPDGRDVGDATARAYRGEGGSGSGTAGKRYAARPRIPRDIAPVERPAVATLAWIRYAQKAYHDANGRYGTLQELTQARLLRLEMPFQNGAFERKGYRFQLKGGPQEFRVDATPLSAGPRPYYVDENGYVIRDE